MNLGAAKAFLPLLPAAAGSSLCQTLQPQGYAACWHRLPVSRDSLYSLIIMIPILPFCGGPAGSYIFHTDSDFCYVTYLEWKQRHFML